MKRGVAVGVAVGAALLLGGGAALLVLRPEAVRSEDQQVVPLRFRPALERIDESLTELERIGKEIDGRLRATTGPPQGPGPLERIREELDLVELRAALADTERRLTGFDSDRGRERFDAFRAACRREVAIVEPRLEELESWLPDTVHERDLRERLDAAIRRYMQGYFELVTIAAGLDPEGD